MRSQRLHPLKPNDRTWTPHHVAFFDTEFPGHPDRPGAPQLFRCVVASAVRRHGTSRRPREAHLRSTDPDELVLWIEATAIPSVPFWLYGHNVAVDVQASGLLDGLLSRGWRLSRHGLGNPSLWALLVRDKRSLHLCDSLSLFGCSERRLGDLMGMPKLEAPAYGDPDERWLEYCERDVEIGLRALLECMDDWEAHDMGRWTDTGPGCGWNSLRHRVQASTVWVDPDPPARAFERSAITGGRRELLQFGQAPESEYCDLDLEHAHTAVAANWPLPAGRGRRFDELALDSPLIGGAGVGCIAQALVSTPSARYPLRTRAGVVYPTGQFWTTLCGPELAEARQRGELVRIGAGYPYVLKHWAARWARWVCEVLEGRDTSVGPMLKLLLKGASKTVWGRSAMRITGTVQQSDGPTEELRLERGWDAERDCGLTIIDWGWTRRVELQDQESDDAFPAVLAWIQSLVRVAVCRLVDQIGEDAIVQVATDGVLCAPWRLAELAYEAQSPILGEGNTSDIATAACLTLGGAVGPLRVRLKDVLHRVRALGPDTVEADEERRIAGVPRSATRQAPWVYQGEVWPSFVTMTQAPISNAVTVTPRRWDASRARPLRWIAQDGRCWPLRAVVASDTGRTWLVPPPRVVGSVAGELRADQHPELQRLRAEGAIEVPLPPV